MNLPYKRITWFMGIVIGGSLILILFSYQLSLTNSAEQLASELETTLANKIVGAGINDSQHKLLNRYLVKRINQDLSHIQVASTFNIIQECQAQVLRLYDNRYETALASSRILTLKWSINEHPQTIELGVSCQHNWPRLIITQVLLAIFAAAILTGTTRPLQGRHKQCVAILTARGYSKSDAMQLCKTIECLNQNEASALDKLTEQTPQHTAAMLELLSVGKFQDINTEQLSWFNYALLRHSEDFQKIVAITFSPNTLCFNAAKSEVIIHGVTIALPSTPFLYFLWYAQQRSQNIDRGGWFINPPSNRADRDTSDELISLMHQYGGHHKAIKDLEEKGLRAKTLDQNRSKIKEELCQALGEELAKPFLFDIERDQQTARFKYRIATAPASIVFYEHEPHFPPHQDFPVET